MIIVESRNRSLTDFWHDQRVDCCHKVDWTWRRMNEEKLLLLQRTEFHRTSDSRARVLQLKSCLWWNFCCSDLRAQNLMVVTQIQRANERKALVDPSARWCLLIEKTTDQHKDALHIIDSLWKLVWLWSQGQFFPVFNEQFRKTPWYSIVKRSVDCQSKRGANPVFGFCYTRGLDVEKWSICGSKWTEAGVWEPQKVHAPAWLKRRCLRSISIWEVVIWRGFPDKISWRILLRSAEPKNLARFRVIYQFIILPFHQANFLWKKMSPLCEYRIWAVSCEGLLYYVFRCTVVGLSETHGFNATIECIYFQAKTYYPRCVCDTWSGHYSSPALWKITYRSRSHPYVAVTKEGNTFYHI